MINIILYECIGYLSSTYSCAFYVLVRPRGFKSTLSALFNSIAAILALEFSWTYGKSLNLFKDTVQKVTPNTIILGRPSEHYEAVPRRQGPFALDHREPGVQGQVRILLRGRGRQKQRAASAGCHSHHIRQVSYGQWSLSKAVLA